MIDWAALASRWGLDGSEPGQRIHRKPPADGVVDTALDSRALKRLANGRRTTATITGMERVLALGMPTLNWDIQLQLDDGSTATARKDEVPPYAWWSAAVGASVPVAVDEQRPVEGLDRLAGGRRGRGVECGEADAPPAASIAAEVEQGSGEAARTAVAGAGRSAGPTPRRRSPPHVTWVR